MNKESNKLAINSNGLSDGIYYPVISGTGIGQNIVSEIVSIDKTKTNVLRLMTPGFF